MPPCRRVCFFVGLVVQHQAQTGFAHAGVAQQHHLCVHIMSAWLCDFAEEDAEVEFPDVDEAVTLPFKCTGVRTDSGKERDTRMERKTRRRAFVSWLRDFREASTGIDPPKPDCIVVLIAF